MISALNHIKKVKSLRCGEETDNDILGGVVEIWSIHIVSHDHLLLVILLSKVLIKGTGDRLFSGAVRDIDLVLRQLGRSIRQVEILLLEDNERTVSRNSQADRDRSESGMRLVVNNVELHFVWFNK